MTGIEERRWAASGENVADMAAAAGQRCLDTAGHTAADVGMLIVASGTPDRRFPGPAGDVAQRLGMGQTPAIDLPVASAGALVGLALAADMADRYGAILVVAAEKMSSTVDLTPMDPNSGMLFGDGAGACLVLGSAVAGWRVVDWVLHSDGSGADLIQLPFDGAFAMDGMGVIVHASRKMPAVIVEVLQKNGVAAGEVDQFLLHQANQNLLSRIARSLGVETGRIYSNIRRYGNTSSASMLIAATDAGPTGELLCFGAFGAGLNWGALLAKKL
jgi:3-oxoacyl-[acyl-carrier-protein] synthase-3